MILSHRKNSLTSLFKEVRVFNRTFIFRGLTSANPDRTLILKELIGGQQDQQFFQDSSVWKFPDLWPSCTNQENILGESISDKLVENIFGNYLGCYGDEKERSKVTCEQLHSFANKAKTEMH